jgi:hypothetical protein
VNVLPVMPSRPLRTLLQVVRFLGQKPAHGRDQVVCIRPRSFLGSIRDALTWNVANVQRWIQQGEDDAAASVK